MIKKGILRLYFSNYSSNFHYSDWDVKRAKNQPYIILDENFDEFKSYFLEQKSNKVTSNCNIYPTTLSSLAKNKIETFNESNEPQISITYTPRKTDYYLLNFQEIFSNILNKENYSKSLIIDINHPIVKKYLKNNFSSIPSDTLFIASCDILSEKSIPLDLRKYLETLTPEYIFQTYTYNKGFTDKLYKWIPLFHQEKPNLIFDETLNTQIFEDNVMDEDTFDSLNEILLSDDKENLKLAIEIMSNYNMESSKIYILSLLNSHYEKLGKKSNSNTPNHLLLLKTFPKRKYEWDHNWPIFYRDLLSKFPQEKELIQVLITKKMNSTLFKNIPIKNIEFKN